MRGIGQLIEWAHGYLALVGGAGAQAEATISAALGIGFYLVICVADFAAGHEGVFGQGALGRAAGDNAGTDVLAG